VNTDADNQYCGHDIETLVRPILDGKADMVIGSRPIDSTEHFSPMKKRLQRFGSWVVRIASMTTILDAPSGFRAYSREAAMQLNVINVYTYTLETIIQAGALKMAVTSVPIHTNPETRQSRLFKSMGAYVKRSMTVIIRAFMMYRPLKFFSTLGLAVILTGTIAICRYLVLLLAGDSGGHVQSLVLAGICVMVGVQLIVTGLQADIIAANRKILEDIQLRVKRMEYSAKEEK
jgi:hypothetical protein